MDTEGYRDHPVRSYVLTGGRSRPTRNTLRPETLLCTVDDGRELPSHAGRHQHTLLRTCRGTLALAEVAAYLRLPVSLVAVLASDLLDGGFLALRSTATHDLPDTELLEEVLDGLRSL
ncbi:MULTISPECIES: DUF742 domain-containing protein [Isoptericola]|uniref:DUF742 domain-containing protein n=1 Tax=Isoptericola sediminis TaxID=2733572 RepID=A0A849JZ29_9MICO|nr:MULTISPECIES: DUF742 domain-containing protein [Isoptericola]MDO8142959.1 DUF742 domain-containing protein [Isoptericola sp. 178]MDO8146820.1 DUF742 domain-containing protein [Isoptericola sp. b515]MDO8150866.1 DUF742 domain-containing protein [Isoptericola sp. b408]NNU26038.1 DUF742 domain-containing protein [Isoptericola sediminis]